MTRSTRPTSTCRRFALRPLPLALAIALTTSALQAHAGGSFTNVQQTVGATISNPNAHTTNVNQSANNAYIQAGGFNIAAQDSVKVFQPSNTSNLLIQVTGYDPSAILGQLQANGRVFLSNPNGVLFGAGARIDVGSLVATNLSMDTDEFMRNRVRLFDRGNSRGSVVNAGSIKADGTVALVGTEVSNLGSIEASRVGLAALSEVVVDVEGDGLIFFQMSGARAGAKLHQLGNIKADGGLVELRAEARGAAADTVLNMDGIIQARSIGSRNGRVIIDGGSTGITKVTGTIDVQGTEAGETGGTVKVLGDRVALGGTALIDASGDAGGGTVLIGGNYQGGGSERRASHTRVADGATVKADALRDGDGGTVVVWADGTTAFQGLIQARGGAEGGNGGTVEVSGKQQLAFWGVVDASAVRGALGTLLLDPDNIFVISDAATPTGTLAASFADVDAGSTGVSGTYSVRASAINASTADITLAANNNITVSAAITRNTAGKVLTMTAGNNITVDAAIDTKNGNLNLNATTITLGADLDAGTADIDLNGNVLLKANVQITADDLTFRGTVNSLDTTARDIDLNANKIALHGSWGASNALGTVDLRGATTLHNDIEMTAGARIKFFSTLDSATTLDAHDLSLTADKIEVTGRIGNAGNLGNLTLVTKDLVLTNSNAIGTATGSVATITNRTANGAIFVKAGSGTSSELYLDPTGDLDRFSGFQQLTIGSATGSGNVTQDGNWNLPTNVLLRSGSGTISLKSSIEADSPGGQGLALSTSGSIDIGDDGGAETFGATRALKYLTVNGGTINLYASSVRTTEDQSYTGNMVLQDTTGADLHTLTGRGIALGAVTSATAGRALTITASGGAAGTVNLNGSIGNTLAGNAQGIGVLTITSSGTTTLGTNATSITTSGTQTYKGATVVKAPTTTITSTANDIVFEKTLDADGTPRNVTLKVDTASKSVTLGGAVGSLSPLGTFIVNGTANINGGDASTAAVTATTQDYRKNVILGGVGTTKTLVADTLIFANSAIIQATTASVDYDLVLRTNALTLNGATSTGGGTLTLVQRTAAGSIGVGTAANETLNLTTGNLDALDSFDALNIGEAGHTSTVEFGAAYTLTQDTALFGDTSVTLLGITGAGHDLAITSASSIFNGNVTGAGALSTSGAATLNGNITGATLIDFGGTATLAGTAGTTRTLDADEVRLNGLAAGDKNILIKADTLTVAGAVTSSGGTATLATHTNGRAIALQTGTAAADLEIGAATQALFSPFSQLTIGRSDSNSAISATSAITLATDTVLISGTGTIALGAVTGGGFDLTLTGSGNTTLSGAFTNVASLTANGGGKTVITTDLATTTSMNFASGENVEFDGGATAITLRSGTLTFSGNLDVDQKNTTLAADSLSLSGTVSNAANADLTVIANTRTAIRVNATSADTALDISTALLGKFAGFKSLTIGSTGANASILTGAITLPTDTTFASGGGSITLGAITGGGFDLTTNSVGNTVTFKGNVAGVHDLTTTGTPSEIVIDTASIATTNKQTYNANVTLGAGSDARTLSAPTIELAAGRTITAGTHDLILQSDTLTLGAGAGISGSAGSDLTLATFTGSKSIGVLGGTGDVQWTSALLSKFTGFSSTTIRTGLANTSTSTGTITVGDGTATVLTLPTNLRLISGTGDIAILNAVDNAVGTLAITSTSGDVLLAQDLGSSGNNLASLDITTGGDITLKGINLFATDATFDGDVVLDTHATSGSKVTNLFGGTHAFKGDIRGTHTGANAESLYANATLTKLEGDVGVAPATRLAELRTKGVELGGQVFTDDIVALDGSITLTGDTRIESAEVSLGGDASTHTVAGGSHDLAIRTDKITTALLSVTGGDQWSLAPLGIGNAIRVSGTGGGLGILLVDPTLLTQWGSFSHMTLGSSDTGAITIAHSSAITLNADLTLMSGSGDVLISSALQGGQALTIDTDGRTLIQADLGTSGNSLSSVTVTGKTEFAGGGSNVTVRTTGNQDYQDTVKVGRATTLVTSAGGVRLRGAVDAATANSTTAHLDIDTTGGSARFDAAVGAAQALTSLTTKDALVNGASVATHGNQTYNGDVTLSSATTTLKGGAGSTVTIDGDVIATAADTKALVIDAPNAVLNGRVGSTGTRLASLQIKGAALLAGGNIFTKGAQTYEGAVTLGAITTLTSTDGDVVFKSTLDSAALTNHALTVNTDGLTRFEGEVGGTRALGALTTDADGSTELAAAVTTTGAQTYNDEVDIEGAVTLTAGGHVTFQSAVNGKTGGSGVLTVNTGGDTVFASTVGKDRALGGLDTDAPGTTKFADDVTIAGAVQLRDAVELTGDTTIKHQGLVFGSTLNGAHALTLDGGTNNTVNFRGVVGGTTALASLSTLGTGTATFEAGASSVTTSGQQRYAGAVALTGTNQVLTAGSLDFGGALSANNGLTLITDELALNGLLSGSGALAILTRSAGTSIGVGLGAGGTLQISQAVLNGTSGFSSLVIGRGDGTGAIEVGTANLGTHTTFRSGNGSIALRGAVNTLVSSAPVDLRIETGGNISLEHNLGSTRALREISTSHAVSTPNVISIAASKLTLQSTTDLKINNLTLTGAGASLLQTTQRMVLSGDINLSGGGTVGLVSTYTPTKVDVTDEDYAETRKGLTVGLVGALREARSGIEQTGGKIVTSAGTTLYVRTPQGASIKLMQADNDIQGGISAVAGRIGESANSTRLTTPDSSGEFNVSFVRISSKQINVLGQPTGDADQGLIAAGIEGDAVLLRGDRINTSANNGLIRARLPYDNNQGTVTAMPGLTLELTANGLNANQAYGGVLESDRLQVSVGNALGGYLTVRPKGGVNLGPGFVSLAGGTGLRPFYDGSGKVTEVQVFYNGDVPQTPQEVGALSAVTAVIEESRRQRFEEAVRTENVSARLRSGVIAEVGAGRPATEGSDSIRVPEACTPAGESLSCQ